MNTHEHRPEAILAEALEIADPAERRAYLDRTCAGDAELRQEVESLLAAYEQADGFMKVPAGKATLPLPLTERSGDRIGRYKLLEQIGEGGFGVVWMAEQEEPVRRRVALKIIKLGMDTKEVVARFEAERQALAMMDHPNIARVFDGGATDTGRPYFVMELVKGIPITEYCDAAKLPTPERLGLFMQVCQAVQHAHQKGVIHRDLKPSNVLVAVQDDRPVPKVIDFGVAKATQARLTQKTVFTRFHQWIGTPAYMSPEQAGLSSLDVDTRSDVYSLGVLLYELLTGRTPFETQTLLATGYDAVMRTIREEEPPKPSTRLSTLAREELSTVAAKRGAEPAKLSRLVRGDLDWIVMKALEKDRTRRYETASAFARDVEAYLGQEPVSAAAPTIGYRLTTFTRRNRVALSTAGLFVLLVLAGASVSVWQAVRATRLAAESEKARQRADEQAAIAAAVNGFLEQDLLARAVPRSEVDEKVEPDLKVRTVLDRASEKIAGRFEHQPLVEASLRATMANAYHELGLHATQELHARRAAELYAKQLGETNVQTLRMMAALGDAERHLGRAMEAVRQLQHVQEIQERVLGPAHTNTLRTMNVLGVAQAATGQADQGRALLVEALRRAEGSPAGQSPVVAELLGNLAHMLADDGQLAEAEQTWRRCLALIKQRVGPVHRETFASLFQLARVLAQEQKFPEAETLFRDAIALSDKLGWTNEEDGTLLANLGVALLNQKKPGEAETAFRESLALRRTRRTSDDPWLADALARLASLLVAQERFTEAEPLLNEALSILKRQPQLDDEAYGQTSAALLATLQAQNKQTELASVSAEMQAFLKQRPALAPSTFTPRAILSALLAERGQLAEAEALMFASWPAVACSALPDPQRILSPTSKPFTADQALKRLQPLIDAASATNHPSHLALWARAALYGQQGRSKDAAEDLARAFELCDALLALPLVPLWMDAGDASDYERYRQQLWARYRRAPRHVTTPLVYAPGVGWQHEVVGEAEPVTAAEVALALALYPQARSYTNADSLAQFAAEEGTNHARLPHFQMVRGLVEYRSGRFEEAAAWTGRSLAHTNVEPATAVMAQAVLAMAQHRLEQVAEATQALRQAEELLRPHFIPGNDGVLDLGPDWPDWIAARVLVKEAQSPDRTHASPPPVAARVNGEVILEHEVRGKMAGEAEVLRRRLMPEPTNGLPQQPSAEYRRQLEQLRQKTLEDLIDRALIVQDADHQGYTVPPERLDEIVRDRIDQRFSDTNTFLQALTASGKTLAQFRAEIEREIIWSAMTQKQLYALPAPSPEVVEKYYQEHPAEFTQPETFEVSLIVITKGATNSTATREERRQLAEEIRARIVAGADFAAEARLHGDGTQAASGGYMGWMELPQLRAELASAAALLQPGGLSPVIDTDIAYFLLRVQGRRPSAVKPFSEVEDSIRKQLDREQRAAARERWLSGLREKAEIERFAPPSN
jgi:eukaryotic-like serine/threonine-protein kinase